MYSAVSMAIALKTMNYVNDAFYVFMWFPWYSHGNGNFAKGEPAFMRPKPCYSHESGNDDRISMSIARKLHLGARMNPDLQGSQNGLSAATRPFEICLFGPTCGGGVCLIKKHYFLALFAYWFHFHDYSEETYPRNDHTWTHGVLCQSERVVSMAIAIKNSPGLGPLAC